ncbi:hypothetical protein D3C85_1056540 [compost metagenome]
MPGLGKGVSLGMASRSSYAKLSLREGGGTVDSSVNEQPDRMNGMQISAVFRIAIAPFALDLCWEQN